MTGPLTDVLGSIDSFADRFGQDFALARDGDIIVVERGVGES